MSIVKEGQKSIRIVLPEDLYNRLKAQSRDYGDISRIVRRLLGKWLDIKEDSQREAAGQTTPEAIGKDD